MSSSLSLGKDSIETYLANRDNRLTPAEVKELGPGIFLARFIMVREGASSLFTQCAVARLSLRVHDISDVKNGVADITYSYTGIQSPETPETPLLHVHENGFIPGESYTIPDPLHGRTLTSVDGYLRPYERTLADLLELAPAGAISIPH